MDESDPPPGEEKSPRDGALPESELQWLRDLESRLDRLQPTLPRSSFARRLEARMGLPSRIRGGIEVQWRAKFAIVRSRWRSGGRRRLLRAVPMGIAALVALSGIVLLHRISQLPPTVADQSETAMETETSWETISPEHVGEDLSTEVAGPPGVAEVFAEGFVPVSAESALRRCRGRSKSLSSTASDRCVRSSWTTKVRSVGSIRGRTPAYKSFQPWQEVVLCPGSHLLVDRQRKAQRPTDFSGIHSSPPKRLYRNPTHTKPTQR